MKTMKLTKQTEKATIEVIFDYSESCHNVYKTFNVTINDKKSNAKGLAKYLTSALPEICTAKVYFWHPSGSASGRRANEMRHTTTVKNFFGIQGFNYENL